MNPAIPVQIRSDACVMHGVIRPNAPNRLCLKPKQPQIREPKLHRFWPFQGAVPLIIRVFEEMGTASGSRQRSAGLRYQQRANTSLGNIDPSVVHRACHILVSPQMFRAIEEFGDGALRDMLRAKPSSYLSLLNTLCNMVQPTIDLENHRIALERAGRKIAGRSGQDASVIGPEKFRK